MENFYFEMKSQMETILSKLEDIKESRLPKLYDTKGLCEYLKVGPSVIEKLRQDGELAYAKIGRTIVYTQDDVDNLIKNNHIKFVS